MAKSKNWMEGYIFKALSYNIRHKNNVFIGEQPKTYWIGPLTIIKVNITKKCQSNIFETLLCSLVTIANTCLTNSVHKMF